MAEAPRLLVVEDDRAMRELLGIYLSGYRVDFAACQEDANRRLQDGCYDLLLLDLRLPVREGELAQYNDVGIAILDQIRRRSLCRCGCRVPLPVVVMTAHGDNAEVPVSVLVEHGANDYITKPFPSKTALLDKIARALAGSAALVPAATPREAIEIRLAFDHGEREVLIETLPPMRGADFELLDALRGLFEEDRRAQRSPDGYRRVKGSVLADRFHVNEEALRRRIKRFRERVQQAFQEQLHRPIGTNDIIENRRNWGGYRLNPHTVHLLAPGELRRG